jgi:hypothetical protein
MISVDQFYQFYLKYMSDERRKKEDTAQGGDFWRNQNMRVGKRFGRAVVGAAQEGRLSYAEAFDLVDLSGGTFDKFATLLGRGNDA